MYNYILSLVSVSRKHPPPYTFNNNFKNGYKRAWIDNIKDYTP